MAYPDSSPTTSYSDPIYDRLDILARAVRARWYIYVTALLLIVFVALFIRRELSNRVDQASAAAFSRAMNGKDEAETLSRIKALAEDGQADPYYRARAYIELAQIRINADDANAAKAAAQSAVTQAATTHDNELKAISRLSLAAAEYQLGDFDAALSDYTGADISLGARAGALDLEATLGKARTLASQGKLSDAAATLEPLIDRTDSDAAKQLDIARVMYWSLKREMQPKPAVAPSIVPAIGATAPGTSSAPLILRPAQPAPAATAAPASK